MSAQRARLNPQGLARKDAPLMSALVPDKGQVFVSCDLSSGEPTCVAHYSQDKNYVDACFNLVGKEPFYKNGVLRIGSIYAMVASVAPTGKKRMLELFNTKFDGVPFPKAFVADPDLIKNTDPKFYALHKIGGLGMMYGMHGKRFCQVAYDAGFSISAAEGDAFHHTFWGLYPGVKAFRQRCEAAFKARRYLVNDFGYRLVPNVARKSLNYMIQSSVSGIMHVIGNHFFLLAPYCTFLLVIHDEVVFSCPENRVEEARVAMKQAEATLNQMLNWRVNVRVGFKVGQNLFEAK